MARSQITENQVLDDDFLSEDEALTLSGSLQTNIDAKPDTLLELEDTPDSYEDGKYLQATTSGVEWSTVSGTDVGTFLDLTDTPTTYSGYEGYYVRVTESGIAELEFDDITDKIVAYGGGVILYPNDTDSDIFGYKNISAYPVDAVEVSDFVITSTSGIIQEFITASGIEEIIIPAGKWVFNVYASTTNTTQLNTVRVDVYLRDSVGTETFVFSEETSPLISLVSHLYKILVIIPNDTAIAADERLVFKFSGVNYVGAAKTITIYYQGNTSYTHIDTPLSSVFLTEHSKLVGPDTADDHIQYLNIDRGDDRYYTETEVDTISGTLQNHIDAKPDTLLELGDTPDSYYDGLFLKSTTSGIEWATASGSAGTFLQLTDTPTTYSGGAGKLAQVNDAEDSVVFDYFEFDPEGPLIPETGISGTYYVNFEGGRLLIGATGNKPDLVYLGPVAGLAFDASKVESCYGVFKIPNAWNTESNITATVNFMNDIEQTASGTCAWHIDYHTYAEGEVYGDKTTTTVDVHADIPVTAAGTYLVEELHMHYDDVNNPLAIGDMVTFRFYRDGLADTMTGDSILFALMFELRVGQNIAGG